MQSLNRDLFRKFLAQTSDAPAGLEIVHAEGCYLTDAHGKKYLDLISGISVSNVGHRNETVIKAVKEQLDHYLYLMVYGEYIQAPQVILAKKISELIGYGEWSTYLVNSGTEATEGAMKLAKKATGRSEFISFRNCYHGSSQGALSLMGNDNLKQPFLPLLPDIRSIDFNDINALDAISDRTAAVFIEFVQGEAGVITATPEFIDALTVKCRKTRTLIIADEIQTGFGRTGKWFAFQHYNSLPDIILMAKGMGGGMPIGAFVSRPELMKILNNNPPLGHITTFGGHPVCAAASVATIEEIEKNNLLENAGLMEEVFSDNFKRNPNVKSFRSKGLLMAVTPTGNEDVFQLATEITRKGVITDWFLFDSKSLRIAPPLTISKDEAEYACKIINEVLAGR